jgi:glucoamylase
MAPDRDPRPAKMASAPTMRGVLATPQPFQFGLCAPGGNSPISAVDPATVPRALDVLTRPGTSEVSMVSEI